MDSESDQQQDSTDITKDSEYAKQQEIPDDISFTKNEKKELNKSLKPKKILVFPSKKVSTTYYDNDGKPVAYTEWRKVKPYSEVIRILAQRPPKNPDKKVIASIGKFPMKTSVWTFKNNDSNIYIGKGLDYIKLESEEFYQMILQALGATQEDEILLGHMINADFMLQHISKSKLPHFKVKDWSPQTVKLNLGEVIEESEKKFNQKEQNRKLLGK